MTPSPDNQQKLEQLIHRTLRDQPPRRAPSSLEERVLGEIQRRASLPWWRKSFKHWPIAARAAFLALSIGVVKLALLASVWVMSGFDRVQFSEAFAPQFTWMEGGLAVGRAVADCFTAVFNSIPPLWLYGGLAVVAATYFTLFGLGAAVYRTFHARR